jgi:HEAT repeat protein
MANGRLLGVLKGRQGVLRGWQGTAAVALGVASMVLLGGLAVAVSCDEPRIGGRTVWQWLEVARQGSGEERTRAAHMLVEYARSSNASLEPLLQLLEDEDPAVRQIGIRVLAEAARTQRVLQARAERVLPVLIEVVRSDSNRDRRENAIQAIGAFGAHGVPGVAALVEIIRADDALIAAAAAKSIALIGPPAAEAIPALIEALGATNIYLSRAAREALSSIGPAAVRPLRDALAAEKFVIHARAAEALGRMRPPPLEELTGWLGDENPRVREGAARALGSGAPPDARAGAPLLGALEDKDAAVRRAALASLGHIPGLSGAAAERIVPHMGDAHGQNRFNAIRAAAGIGEPAVDVLIAALEHADPQIRSGAAAALARLRRQGGGHPGERAITRLLPLLDDEDAEVQVRSAEALAALGAVAGLREAARDDRAQVRMGAIFAIGQAGRLQSFRTTLADGLEDADPRVRREAVLAAGAVIEKPGEGGGELEQALQRRRADHDPGVRYYAARVLARRDEQLRQELNELALQLSREHPVATYHGFEQDLVQMQDQWEWVEGTYAAPEAITAAHRFAERAPLIGQQRAAVLEMLGKPGERLGWPDHEGREASGEAMTFRFEAGFGGVAFSVYFQGDVVVDVEVLGRL